MLEHICHKIQKDLYRTGDKVIALILKSPVTATRVKIVNRLNHDTCNSVSNLNFIRENGAQRECTKRQSKK